MDELKQLSYIFDKLQSTTSRNEKEQILIDNIDNQLLSDVLTFLYDPYIVTGISTQKIEKKVGSNYVYDLFDCFGTEPKPEVTLTDMLKYLKKNNTGRDADLNKVYEYIQEHPEHAEMLKQIFTKDLKLGIQSTTINKIWEGFKRPPIPKFDVMLAENYFDNMEYLKNKAFILTQKLDGSRCIATRYGKKIQFFTRQGQPYGEMPEIASELMLMKDEYVYDGELIAYSNEVNTEKLFRETVSKARRGGTKTGLVFHIFDMIPLESFRNGRCKTRAYDRKRMLHETIEDAAKAKGRPLDWLEEVRMLYTGSYIPMIEKYLEEITACGGEGVMINLYNSGYECKRTKELLRVKKFKTADLRVVDIYEGTGRNVGKLGGITVEFEHEGKLYRCGCGSGFSDEERVKYWRQKYLLMEKIVEIKYFEISQNADGSYGLRFPTWIGKIRTDKNEISMY